MTNTLSVVPPLTEYSLGIRAIDDIRTAVNTPAQRPAEIIVRVINILDAYGEATEHREHEDPRKIREARAEVEAALVSDPNPGLDSFIEFDL